MYPIVNKEVTNYTNQNIKIENSILNSENIIDDYYIEKDGKDSLFSGYWKVYNNPGRAKMIFWAYDKAKTSAVNEYLIGKSIRDIAYVAAC